MISIQKKTQCSGCRSCEQACPYACIEMQSDEEGFIYPKVNQEKCIGCNACNKACPIETISLSKSISSGATPNTWGCHKTLSVLKALWSRFGQFVKFGIVGCSNTIINLAVYYLCLYLGAHYLAAYTLGFLVSVCNAFFWNNMYVFKNKRETSLFRAFIKVFVSYGASFLLSILLIGILVEMLDISSVLAPILKMIITVPLNFALVKIWAFRDKK